ncbi:MAG: DUF697 domain-containing protein [Myxococcota bacterium]
MAGCSAPADLPRRRCSRADPRRCSAGAGLARGLLSAIGTVFVEEAAMQSEERAEELISNHVAGAAAAAAIPIPLVDLVAVTAVQLSLMRKLGRLYGAEIGVDAAGAVGVGLLGALLPRVAASALKIFPGVGSVGGALAQAALSGATTWALAQSLRDRLQRRPLDPDTRAHADVSRSLERADRLRRRGLLSDEEYARTRAELLDAL